MIQVQIQFRNGGSRTISTGDSRVLVAKIEEIMWREMPRIERVNVLATGLEVAEAVRMQSYFQTIELDTRLDHIIDRQGLEHFDLYEIAKYPRRRVE